MVLVIPRDDSHEKESEKPFDVVVWGLLFGVYLLGAYPVLDWIVAQSPLGLSGTSLLVIGIVVLGMAISIFGLPKRRLPLAPLGLILGCSALSLLTYPILQQISAAFALMGLYGFAAGFTRFPPGYWRQGLILAGLAALVLPFALVRGTGLGFYLRLMTADAAAHVLSWMGYASLGAHDVLIFDNGIAQVDAPCSGLKSLFTGTGFFLAASLVLRRRVSRRWLGLYGAFIALLLVANTVRVIILIYISEIAGEPAWLKKYMFLWDWFFLRFVAGLPCGDLGRQRNLDSKLTLRSNPPPNGR